MRGDLTWVLRQNSYEGAGAESLGTGGRVVLGRHVVAAHPVTSERRVLERAVRQGRDRPRCPVDGSHVQKTARIERSIIGIDVPENSTGTEVFRSVDILRAAPACSSPRVPCHEPMIGRLHHRPSPEGEDSCGSVYGAPFPTDLVAGATNGWRNSPRPGARPQS